MNKVYDYIIIGAGCAGLSLAYRMSKEPHFKERSILLIEPEDKNKNDRTWSYWSKTNEFYNQWANKSWEKIAFKSNATEKPKPIAPYKYYTIKGEDFYQHTLSQIKKYQNIHLLKDHVNNLEFESDTVRVQTKTSQVFEGKYCFDSRINSSHDYSKSNFVWQHFKGWVVETERNYFDDSTALFMDFSVPQENETRFFYLLPYSKKEALIELAIFSNDVLSSKNYDVLLNDYILENHPNLKYRIKEEEYNKIPMTDFKFPISAGRNHMFIGTASGMVKASSGYAFKRIQDQSSLIIKALKANDDPQIATKKIANEKFRILDATLLDVILEKRLTGKEVFVKLLERNKISTVFDFLNQESSLMQELKIMTSLPTLPFLKSFIKILTN